MPAPYRRIMPGDWVRLERLINEIFGILNAETTLSDVVLNSSDLQVVVQAVSDVVVANSSNIVWLESDAKSVKSDTVVIKSDITSNDSDIVVLKSDTLTNASDIAVVAAGAGPVSDVTTNTSDIASLRSDLTLAESTMIAKITGASASTLAAVFSTLEARLSNAGV